MSKKIRAVPFLLFLVLLILLSPAAFPQATKPDSELLVRLKALPGVVEAKEARFDEKLFKEAYELMFEQPLDHRNPQGMKFRQRFFVSHADYAKPVVLETSGYAAFGAKAGELTRILGGNQVTVEHRFFGRSVPVPVDLGISDDPAIRRRPPRHRDGAKDSLSREMGEHGLEQGRTDDPFL